MPEGEFEFIARRLRRSRPPAAPRSDRRCRAARPRARPPAGADQGRHGRGRAFSAGRPARADRAEASAREPVGSGGDGRGAARLSAGIGARQGDQRRLAREFCAGLAADNAAFGITLLGGDTVSTPGPLTSRSPRSVRRPRLGAPAARRGAGRRRLGLRHARRWRARPEGAASELEGQRRARLRNRAVSPAPAAPRAGPGAARHRERGDRCLGRSGRGPRPHPRGLRGGRRTARRHAAALGRRPRLPARATRRSRAATTTSCCSPRRRSVGSISQRSRADSTSRSPASVRSGPNQAFTCWMRKGRNFPVRQAGWQHF